MTDPASARVFDLGRFVRSYFDALIAGSVVRWLRPGELWWGDQLDDLADFPDDGRRYEPVEGSLHVSPGPIRIHQRIVTNMFVALRAACPPGEKRLEAAPLMAVEILSQSTPHHCPTERR